MLSAIILIILILVITVLSIKFVKEKIYPLKYKEYILMYCDDYNVDPNLVAAIISVESKFNKDVVSSKGAIGLMQILPETAIWISQQNSMKEFEEWMLYTPEVNIKMGTWYINHLYKQFEDIDLILAAYNGGSGNVSKWLEDEKYSKDGKTLDIVPFKETREYIKKVNFRRKVYKYLYDL
ncbi:lytic transglycosylase domain-containing protein [Clostridium sp. D2Q-14]|nr:lytic transglycosylase domain-containing protein [Anaeromonas gelatinilytica]